MKQLYTDPQLEIYRFDSVDVLTASMPLQPEKDSDTVIEGDSVL